jgi:hypothetical protein
MFQTYWRTEGQRICRLQSIKQLGHNSVHNINNSLRTSPRIQIYESQQAAGFLVFQDFMVKGQWRESFFASISLLFLKVPHFQMFEILVYKIELVFYRCEWVTPVKHFTDMVRRRKSVGLSLYIQISLPSKQNPLLQGTPKKHIWHHSSLILVSS